MKRTSYGVLTAVMLLVCFVLYAGVAAAQQVTLTFAHWGSWDEANMYQEIIDQFEAAHPNVRVEVIPMSWEEYGEKIVTMMIGGAMPDVLQLNDFQRYVDVGALADLDPFIERTADFYLDDYFPPAVEAFRYRNAQYGLPNQISTQAIVYNVEVVLESGVDIPNDLDAQGVWNWDGFVDWGKRLVRYDSDGNTIRYAFHPTELTPFILANNASIFDDRGNVTLDSPEFIEAIDWIYRLSAEHNISPPASNWGGSWMRLNNRELVSMPSWPLIQTINDAVTFEWDVVRYPDGKSKATIGGFGGLGMSATSEHPELAWELLRWLTGYEANLVYAKYGWGIPPLREVAVNEWMTLPGLPKHAQAFIDAVDDIPKGTSHPMSGRIQPIVNSAFWNVLTGAQDAASALADAAQQARAIVSEWEASRGSINVADRFFGARVSSSVESLSDEFLPQNVIDQNTGTAFVSMDNPTLPQTLTIQFGAIEFIDRVVLVTGCGGGQGITEFDIQVSLDGETWETVMSVSEAWSQDCIEESRLYRFDPVEAGYLRLLINDANLDWAHYAINEIEVWSAI